MPYVPSVSPPYSYSMSTYQSRPHSLSVHTASWTRLQEAHGSNLGLDTDYLGFRLVLIALRPYGETPEYHFVSGHDHIHPFNLTILSYIHLTPDSMAK